MNNRIDLNQSNGVNGTGTLDGEGVAPGRLGVIDPAPAGRYPATDQQTRRRWSKQVNVVIMECYFLSKPVDENGVPVRGYRKRMHRQWQERGMFQLTEQRLCDQARAIRKNHWLTEVELELIKRRVLENSDQGDGEIAVRVEDREEADDEMIEEDTDNPHESSDNDIPGETGIDSTEESESIRDMTAEQKMIYDRIKARLQEDNDEIICNLKKADQWKLTQETQKVNKVLKYIRTSNITETNNLIKAASMVVAENMGMDVRKKNANRSDRKEPWWKRRIQESIKTILKGISVLD